MARLKTAINSASEDFVANRAAMAALVDDLAEKRRAAAAE